MKIKPAGKHHLKKARYRSGLTDKFGNEVLDRPKKVGRLAQLNKSNRKARRDQMEYDSWKTR